MVITHFCIYSLRKTDKTLESIRLCRFHCQMSLQRNYDTVMKTRLPNIQRHVNLLPSFSFYETLSQIAYSLAVTYDHRLLKTAQD